MSEPRVVAVAMSGGVDSSVAAALLAETGEQVFGLMLRLWSAGERYPNRCCSPRDVSNARNVCAQLGIPFYVLDAQEPFKRSVVDRFVAGYQLGITPNPCLACNREIRWGLLFEKALQLGATHMATGHYARRESRNGSFHLLRAVDRAKDQSYVLSVLGQREIQYSLFPLGELEKPEVRSHARSLDLEIADRQDSQDLCFLGGADYRSFLSDHGLVSANPGPILDQSGEQLGTHPGLHAFTLGQRKGLRISASHPLYVVAKDRAANTLVVGPREALLQDAFKVEKLNWISGAPPGSATPIQVQVRYRARAVNCSLDERERDSARVELTEALPAVTPGQAAVFYMGEECLGGGIIAP
jgi:tRNA-specific 2-thiouridylase